MRVRYISWAPYCSRSDNTARELGGRSFMVYASRLGSHPITIIPKYLIQSLWTMRLLHRESPSVVFVMSPPPVAALPVLAYCRLRRIPFVIDAHSGAFLDARWRRLQWFQRSLCRKAATTVVTNEYLAEQVRTGGGHSTVIRDVPVRFERVKELDRTDAFTVAVVCSFNADEPLDDVVEAARALPDIRFLVSGDPAKAGRGFRDTLPTNVELTGFLSIEQYGGLLRGVDAVVALTTRNHTMVRGAYEAVYQGTPVVVSDWPILRHAFDEGAVHAAQGGQSLADALRELRCHYVGYKTGVQRLRARKLEEWSAKKEQLLSRVKECGG